MFKEFKEFAMRGNVVDMAVGMRPLPGTGVGRMTSNAESRSVCTTSKRSASIS